MRENKRNILKHIAALMTVLFCMVMSIGMVCFADEQGTISVKSARIRASADPNSEQLGSVAQGKTVDIIGKTTGTDGQEWYQVYVDSNTKGYIRGNLVKLKDGASLKTVDGSVGSTGSDASASTNTSADAKKVAVINKANIRKDASTNGDPVATANRGMVLTVQGETTGSDGMKWYQVSFTYQDKEVTGYVRSDLVTSDNIPADSVSSEINGEANPGEEQQPEEQPEPDQQPEEQPEPDQQPSSSFQPINVDEEPPYIMQGFEAFKFKLPGDDQEYDGYQNDEGYIICYAQMPSGEEGWCLVNISMNICQPYVYAMEGIETPKSVPGGLISVIVLVVIIIILVAVIGLLLLKSRERGDSYKGYDDEDEDSDDDIEDLEEMEEEPQPIRRPQGAAGPQPVRRPQGAAGPQPVRRPQGNPAERPMSQGQPIRHPQGGAGPQPMRRPQNGPAPQEPQPIRRPQGAGPSAGGARPQPGAGPQPVRRPQGAPQPARRPQGGAGPQPGQGYKAKNLLDDDMDMMDIDND